MLCLIILHDLDVFRKKDGNPLKNIKKTALLDGGRLESLKNGPISQGGLAQPEPPLYDHLPQL